MTKKEATQILAILSAAYPSSYRNMTEQEAQGTVMVWCTQFGDISAEVVMMAVNKCISSSKFPPTVAEVKEKIKSVHWEAYEELNQHYTFGGLSEDEVDHLKRIAEETRNYKFSVHWGEPSVGQMLRASDRKLLKGD